MPDAPCFTCGGQRWWLLGDGSAWRCEACHPPVSAPDRKALAPDHANWRVNVRVTVASHHWQAAKVWLRDPFAYTIMAWPPTKHGWPVERNVSLFAPTGDILRDYRAGVITDYQYTKRFGALMQLRLPQIRQWLRDHDSQQVTLLCACPGHSIDERFCHRYLVAKLLVWLGCSEEPWVQVRQERKVVA